jgi:3-oxoacyl-[acyl-carrier protein] reductase
MAKELGQFGITVNSVAPGFIVTDMTRAVAERLGIEFEVMRAKGAKAIPVRRTGAPEDIAQVVSFFADERSGFVSGQVVYAAGGPVD